MVGIIGAMQTEIDTIIKEVKNLKEVDKGIRTFYTGTISNKEVVITIAGIGKVNAGVTTSLLIENFDIESIVNIGVAGGVNGVKHKDVVISSEVLYHDVDVTLDNKYVRGQLPKSEPTYIADKSLISKTKSILELLNFDYKLGRIASGDQFVHKLDEVKQVVDLYEDIYAVEMESAAIAHVATMYDVPFIIYRSISDVIGDENQVDDFYKFVEEAAVNASLVLSKLLEVI